MKYLKLFFLFLGFGFFIPNTVLASNYYLTTVTSSDYSYNLTWSLSDYTVTTATNTTKSYSQAVAFCALTNDRLPTFIELQNFATNETTSTPLGYVKDNISYWVNTSSMPILYPTKTNCTYFKANSAWTTYALSFTTCGSSLNTICVTSTAPTPYWTVTGTINLNWADQVITPSSSNSTNMEIDYTNTKYIVALLLILVILTGASLIRKMLAR